MGASERTSKFRDSYYGAVGFRLSTGGLHGYLILIPNILHLGFVRCRIEK